jgi:hypothetical protein
MQEAAAKGGYGGNLYLDVDPQAGFLRLKLTNLRNLQGDQLISIFSQVISQAARMVNLEVKQHVRGGNG